MKYSGTLFIVSAPSGAGKTTLVQRLVEETEGLEVSVSHTTRSQRPGEIEGKHYHFINEDQYQQMVADDKFLEHAKVFGNYYGTSKEWVQRKLELGIDIILELDWQGARIMTSKMAAVATIFVMPPSRQSLEKRLNKRGQDDSKVIASRMGQAVSEMSHYHEYDFLIINDDLETAYADLQAVIRAARLAQSKQSIRHSDLIEELLAT